MFVFKLVEKMHQHFPNFSWQFSIKTEFFKHFDNSIKLDENQQTFLPPKKIFFKAFAEHFHQTFENFQLPLICKASLDDPGMFISGQKHEDLGTNVYRGLRLVLTSLLANLELTGNHLTGAKISSVDITSECLCQCKV